MFTQTINRNQLDVRPFMLFSLLVMLITQLGTLPMPRVSANAPATQAEVQQKIMTDTAATGLVDWAKIEGVRSDADIQKIAQPQTMPQKKEVPGVPLWGTAHMPTLLVVNSAGINVVIEKTEIVDGRYQTNRGVANWLANASLGQGNTLVFWAVDFGYQERLDMPFYHLSPFNDDAQNDLVPSSVMMINDNMGDTYGYVYESMLTVSADDTSWMQQDDANRVILIASAGSVIRDNTGHIVDTTHRRIFIFRRMSLGERVVEGLD